jgi:hypothetical protein
VRVCRLLAWFKIDIVISSACTSRYSEKLHMCRRQLELSPQVGVNGTATRQMPGSASAQRTSGQETGCACVASEGIPARCSPEIDYLQAGVRSIGSQTADAGTSAECTLLTGVYWASRCAGTSGRHLTCTNDGLCKRSAQSKEGGHNLLCCSPLCQLMCSFRARVHQPKEQQGVSILCSCSCRALILEEISHLHSSCTELPLASVCWAAVCWLVGHHMSSPASHE